MTAVRRALIFSTADRYFALISNFLVTAAVSRILTPAEIGIFVLGQAILGFALSVKDFASSGFIIQREELTRDDVRASFTVTLDGLSSFGGDRPRAIIARAKPSPPLLELQAEHERLMRRIGIPAEPRKFTPHITLARLRSVSPMAVADYLSTRAFLAARSFVAERFVLFSSRASTGGGPYLVEAAYPLR